MNTDNYYELNTCTYYNFDLEEEDDGVYEYQNSSYDGKCETLEECGLRLYGEELVIVDIELFRKFLMSCGWAGEEEQYDNYPFTDAELEFIDDADAYRRGVNYYLNGLKKEDTLNYVGVQPKYGIIHLAIPAILSTEEYEEFQHCAEEDE